VQLEFETFHFFWFDSSSQLALRLIGMGNHPDMQKIRIIGFSLKIGFIGILKLDFYYFYLRMYLRLNLSTMPDLKF
jgi:hypothetical protein